MKTFLIAAAALAVPGAASAMEARPAAAQPANLGLVYTTTLTENGTVLLEGEEAASGRRFKFKMLSDGWVSGKVGQREVRYAVRRSLRDRLVAKLRQRDGSGASSGF